MAFTKLDPMQEPKWSGMIKRHNRKSPEWGSLLSKARQSPILGNINRLVNKSAPYISDGVDNQWKTPMEFMRDGGDCEDAAITKHLLLKDMGIDSQVLFLDTHAVTVVGNTVLDNTDKTYKLTPELRKRVRFSMGREFRVYPPGGM